MNENNQNNEKKFGIEDPRLTAYLLNELDAEERIDLEKQIAGDPDLAQAVADLEITIGAIRQALQNEPLPESSAARADLASKTAESKTGSLPVAGEKRSPGRKARWRFKMVISAAVVVLIAVTALFYINSGHRYNVDLARSGKKDPQAQNAYNQKAIDTDSSIGKNDIGENKADSRQSSFHRQDSVKQDENSLKPAKQEVAKEKTGSRRKDESNSEVITPKSRIDSSGINAKPADQSTVQLEESAKSKTSMDGADRAGGMGSSMPKESTTAQNAVSAEKKPATRSANAAERMPESAHAPSASAPMHSAPMGGKPGMAMIGAGAPMGGMAPGMSTINEMPSRRRGLGTLKYDKPYNSTSKAKRSIAREEEMKTSTQPQAGQAIMAGRLIDAENEDYAKIAEKSFVTPKEEPFSTFSIDVDTASWSNIRRFLNSGFRPPEDAVKIEEIVNYFKYNYKAPDEKATDPFAVHTETAPCPWCPDHLLVKIGIKGKEIKLEKRPPLNLVFLIDTSGSMYSENKLPLVKKSLAELTEMLTVKDRIAIVTYGSDARVALESVSGTETAHILDIVNGLSARGSTAGAAGIKTAYEIARKQFDKSAANRVILCTDGDFNVGMTSNQDLEKMIEKEAKSGVYLSILGFGMGNYKDVRLATLSNKGNGNYGYIDTLDEARRLLVQNLTGTLITIAKDVKIQVDFNPNQVVGYRLLGYEDRHLAAEDFNNDKKDAGEIGAGHTVTALYEIVPVGVDLPGTGRIDQSRYAEVKKQDDSKKADEVKNETKASTPEKSEPKKSESKKNDAKSDNAKKDVAKSDNAKSDDAKKDVAKSDNAKSDNGASSAQLNAELMFVKICYKQPDATKSTLMTAPVLYKKDAKAAMSSDYKFACAAALFGLVLRDSAYIENADLPDVLKLVEGSVGDDKDRKEFIELVKKAIANKDRAPSPIFRF